LERKKWLAELEEQKKEKFVETQRVLNNYSLNPADLSPRELKHHRVSAMSNHPPQLNTHDYSNQAGINNITENRTGNVTAMGDEEKNFGRTRMLLDPAQIDEMERKKKQALQHKREIDAQIAEKKRIQLLEEEIKVLNDLKVENEAKHIKSINQLSQETRRQQPQYTNLNANLNQTQAQQNNTNTKRDTMASVMHQGEASMFDQDSTSRSDVSQTRAQEIYRKMQEAELAAAEEKHKRLLKRLQRGGHDTRQLEKKFAELKARLTGNPSGLYNYNTSIAQEASNHKPNNFGADASNSNRGSHGMSEVMNHELNLERQKQMLEKQIIQQQQASNSNEKLFNKENFDLSNDQKSKIQKIFQLMREDTNGLPAELDEENLKQLLKTVGRYSKDDQSVKRSANQKEKVKEKEVKRISLKI
jgi:hypothetical protein